MIKTKIVAFLFCLASTIANAQVFQQNRVMQCDKATEIVSILQKYGEVLAWQGKNLAGLINILAFNPNTKTWSQIITDGNIACVLDAGEGFVLQGPQPQTQKNKVDPSKLVDISYDTDF